MRRDTRTRSDSVEIVIPGSTRLEHAGTSTRDPVTSTTHTRQTLTGVKVGRKQSVGMSTPRARHASRMVELPGTVARCPSMTTSTGGAAGRLGAAGGRLGGGGGWNQIGSGFTLGAP